MLVKFNFEPLSFVIGVLFTLAIGGIAYGMGYLR